MIKMDDIESVESTSKEFRISWSLTRWCNYSCPYCVQGRNRDTKKYLLDDEEKVCGITRSINSMLDKIGRDTVIAAYGGEIGFYNLANIFSNFTSKYIKKITVLTNLSNEADYWISLKSFLEKKGIELRILASIHTSQCNVDDFIRKAELLKDFLKVKAVVSHDNYDEVKRIFETLWRKGVRTQFAKERDSNNQCAYLTEEESKSLTCDTYSNIMFNVTLKDGSKQGYCSFQDFIGDIDIRGFKSNGFYCNGGINGVKIDENGDIKRTSCVKGYDGGIICNVKDFIELPTDMFICKYPKFCPCSTGYSMYRTKPC